MKVCIGGTFDHLHKGHKALINKAFKVAGKKGFVFIGLTLSKIDDNKKNIESFEKRKKNLKKFLEKKDYKADFKIKPLSDKYGPSVVDNFDAIVVSPETKNTAVEINKKRKKKNKKPLKIFTINYVLSDDGRPVSSTRIRKKQIDEKGNVLT